MSDFHSSSSDNTEPPKIGDIVEFVGVDDDQLPLIVVALNDPLVTVSYRSRWDTVEELEVKQECLRPYSGERPRPHPRPRP